jgi:WD40 repeat protein
MWDVSPQQSTNILRHAGYTSDVTFSPDGTVVAAADYTAKTAVLWRVLDQTSVTNVGKHPGRCTGVKFSSDGRLLATVGDEAYVQIWRLSPLEKLFDFPAGGSEASVVFHPSKPLLAVGRGDLRFCDLQHRAPVRLLENAPTNGVTTVTFSPSGESIALGLEDGQVSVWDFATRRLLFSFREHSGGITSLCFSHNERWLASGGLDHLAVIYDMSRRQTPARLDDHTLGVHALAFAPGDKTLVSTSWDGFIRFWALSNHQVALTLAHDGGPVTSVAFSPNGNLMATSGSDRTIRLWPAEKWVVSTTTKQAEANRK